MELETVRLIGAQETTLATLYGKAMESRRPNTVLADREADKALQRIDYDFSRLRIRRTDHTSLAVRAKAYDTWARQFLDNNPHCTVLHLGCGLDTRVHRVDPPPRCGGTTSTSPMSWRCAGGSSPRHPPARTRPPCRSPIRSCSTRSPATGRFW